MNDKQIFFNLAKGSCFGSTLLNSTIIYSLFVYPIFVPAITAVICNPLFALPSLFLNYALFQRYYVYFFSESFIKNMFLKPNGKQVMGRRIEWAANGETAALQHVGVDHGGFDVFVSQ